MADYKSYLAASILTEDKVVTYRLLSRVLKIHVNAAKEMLFDFHRQQNAKKPGTIHATYLVSGTKRVEEPTVTNGETIKKDGDDDVMQSSPFMNSSMPEPEEDSTGEISVLTVSLIPEEELEETQLTFEQISSIHIYSLSPHPFKDLQVLSDVTRQIQELSTKEDPLEFLTTYGTIANKNVKRRTSRRPPPAPAPAPVINAQAGNSNKEPSKPATQPTKSEPKPSQPSNAKDFFGKGKEKTQPAAAASNPSSKESTPNPPALKREPSSIFKAFAKSKAKQDADVSSAAASPVASAPEDEPMKDVSDDGEETYVPPPRPAKKNIVDNDRKSRLEREKALKEMMEEEDDEDEVVATPEVEEVDDSKPEEPAVEVKEEPAVVSDGRRRGRRRVMKKKTVKDAEGYLVTKEEAVWESFSEDEPVAKSKPKAQASMASKKKPAAKAGQGNIMSFFGKK